MAVSATDLVLVIDVGNSGAKLGAVRGNDVTEPVRLPRLDDRAIRAAIESLLADPETPVAVAGSDPAGIVTVCRMVADLGIARAIPIRPDYPGLPPARVRQPEKAGVDRRAQVLGAVTLAGGPAAVVACGTAITVDLADADGALIGGAIFPGLGLGARALAKGTAELPEIELAGEVVMPGLDTEEAIRAGLRLGAAGAVEHLLRVAGAEKRPIFLTGQDAKHLASLLSTRVRPHSGIGLLGVAAAVRLAESG